MRRRLGGSGRWGATFLGMTLAVAFTIGASGCADDDTLTVVVGMDGGTDSDVESVDPADTGVELLNKNDGGPGAKFAKSAIAFQSVACGSAQSQTLSVTNSGGSPLALSVTATGGAFSVSPTALTVESGKTGRSRRRRRGRHWLFSPVGRRRSHFRRPGWVVRSPSR
jgi:hypothetical protein